MSLLYTAWDYTVFPYIINILVVVPEIVAEHPAVILEKYEIRSARVYIQKKNKKLKLLFTNVYSGECRMAMYVVLYLIEI